MKRMIRAAKQLGSHAAKKFPLQWERVRVRVIAQRLKQHIEISLRVVPALIFQLFELFILDMYFLFLFYCLGFCFTIAIIDCALLVINSAIATSSFTLRKIRSAQIKRERKYQRKRKISLGIRTLRVHYALFGHCLRSKHLQALGLYAHIAHNCNEVA